MATEFKDYQEKAILRLRSVVNELLDSSQNEVVVFKSPTGSGKTLMTAEFLRRVVDSRSDDKKLSFIWIAVNKLHDQSRNSLKKFYESEAVGIRCSLFDDLIDRQIQENEILFLNWASVNNDSKVLIRDNEHDNNLSSVIERTVAMGRTIILIIDESHHTASSANSAKVINIINPKVTIEVSATPQISSDYIVPVKMEDVRAEGMIKKEIVVNEGFDNYVVAAREKDTTADEVVLDAALKKRSQLKQLFDEEGSDINPLVLIQLPDNKTGVPDKKEDVLKMLTKLGYEENDPRVAVYLTGNEKINLLNIEKPNNEVEVMLFKQAIALGWDCPRAAILVLFRQWTDTNITFSIQTLGRIMRMPEQRHYLRGSLNRGYLYTSLPDIETRIENDIQPDFKLQTSTRIPSYRNIKLKSYHSKRFREETRLSSDFVSIFTQASNELNLRENFSFDHEIPVTKLMYGGQINNADEELQSLESKGHLDLVKNEAEIQIFFDRLVSDNLDPFYPESRSIKRVSESLYMYFDATRDEDRWPQIQASVLAEENLHLFLDVMTRAKEIYMDKIGRGKTKVVVNDIPWEIPETLSFNSNYTRKNYEKSVLTPYYARTKEGHEEDSAIEGEFIEYLNSSPNVEWWFKNGVSDATFFGIPYKENGLLKVFYVDFIVMLKSGKIGLFDTKAGITAETARTRAEGLANYVAIENEKGKSLIGGIVVKSGESWKVNSSKNYEFNEKNLSTWNFLDLT